MQSDEEPRRARIGDSAPRCAVLIPCLNEAPSVSRVVHAFRQALPAAVVYVYDNGSTDQTATAAAAAGAVVRREPRPGKGNVVRRMFADVEADVYLLVDGDGTYDASVATQMVQLLLGEQLDMVVAARRGVYDVAHRRGHGLGNRLFNTLYRNVFGEGFRDIFSGYRAFSRRFVKSFPANAPGFEIETEISVHASQLRLPVAEVEADYGKRQEGSASKLNSFRDAVRILAMMTLLYKENRPVRFFGSIATVLAVTALVLGIPLIETFAMTGQVPRFPTAILATGLVLLGAISLTCGIILDSVARGRLEQKRFAYLSLGREQSPSSADELKGGPA